MVIALLLFVIAACNVVDTSKSNLLNTGNIPLDEYTVDITRDTVLTTKRGAIIRIPAGSIEAKDSKITLQLREAFSIADIVAAGLTTTSNGTPLSSGGMIYINAAEQNDARVVKPIAVSIPTDYLQKGMELYKGEVKEDGSINWVEPEPLQQTLAADPVNTGNAIFTSKCKSCHSIGHSNTDLGYMYQSLRNADTSSGAGNSAFGADLAFITERREQRWLDSIIIDGYNFSKDDEYAHCALSAGCSDAHSFTDIDRSSLDAIYAYIENESKKYDAAEFPDLKKTFDSCKNYELLYSIYQKTRKKFINQQGERVEVQYYTSDSITVRTRDTVLGTGKVYAPSNPAVYYKFEVDAFGWYNIDQVVDKVDGYEDAKLTVTVQPIDNTPDVFLIVPSEKIFQRGGFVKGNSEVYGFYQDDGRIRLPQHVDAYILAVSEVKGKIMMGIQPFTIGPLNEVTAQMDAVTKEEYESKMQQFKAEGLNATVNKSKYADSILVLDRQLEALEALRPKNFDCQCHCAGDMSEATN